MDHSFYHHTARSCSTWTALYFFKGLLIEFDRIHLTRPLHHFKTLITDCLVSKGLQGRPTRLVWLQQQPLNMEIVGASPHEFCATWLAWFHNKQPYFSAARKIPDAQSALKSGSQESRKYRSSFIMPRMLLPLTRAKLSSIARLWKGQV